jgi:hypothetical protein
VQQGKDKAEGQEENEVEQEAFNKVEQDEFKRLNKFSCINLLNETFRQYASQNITKEFFNDIKLKCTEFRYHFNDYLTSTLHEMINKVFDDLKQFQFE